MLNPGNKLRLAYGTRESRESKFARNIIDRETDSSKLETHAAVRSNQSVKRELMDRTGGVHQQTVESV